VHRDCNSIKRNYNKLKLNFDPRKDASNHAKHGLSLGMAEELEWETLQCKADTRREYDEPRQIGYAISGEQFVLRGFSGPSRRRTN
jgi:uncharacterized DUF497 family protein